MIPLHISRKVDIPQPIDYAAIDRDYQQWTALSDSIILGACVVLVLLLLAWWQLSRGAK